jgi:proteasome accessory factor C
MLPWLMERGEVPIAEVARRYDLTEAQVEEDLELVAMCGLPPYIDEMVDVFIDDGMVYVGVPRLFTRPLRLSAPEAFALVTSASAAMELPGADASDALGRGLAKLASALGAVGIDAGATGLADVVVELAAPPMTDRLTEAAAEGREVAIEYYSPARDEMSSRTIVPRHVFAEAGNWYVLAEDGRSGERRTFRIDRIEAIEPTGMVVASAPDVVAPTGFFDDPDVPRAVVHLAPDALWVVEAYPTDEARPVGDGWTEVRLPVANDRWLARLMIRLGPSIRLIDPPVAPITRELARTMLAHYRAVGST